VLGGGLGHRWPIPNSWDRDEGEEEEDILKLFIVYSTMIFWLL